MMSQKFIAAGEKYSTMKEWVNAPYLRKKFIYTPSKKAELYICGLGFYELFLNGEKITKGHLAPYMSNPDVRYAYDYYDLTDLLNDGENVLGVLLGNGYLNCFGGYVWNLDKAEFRSAPKLALSFLVDGKLVFEADESFLCSDSPIFMDELRIGEYYDARLEEDNWARVDFDDSTWHPAIPAKSPKGVPFLCDVNPIHCTKVVPAVSYWEIERGVLFDFGENLSGVCRLKIKGNCGQKITMTFGEVLVEGRMLYMNNICDYADYQKDIYICRGTGDFEYFEPSFTYHGFRYVFVEGVQRSQITPDLMTMHVWHSDFPSYSSIVTDNETINRLQRMVTNSNLANYLYIATDCPHREKNGWCGDFQLSTEQMLHNFDCSKEMRETLRNFCGIQREDGNLPAIYPTTDWGFDMYNGPGQNGIIVEIPYQLYRFTGNKDIIRENAEVIKKYFKFLSKQKTDDGMYVCGFGCDGWEWGNDADFVSSTPHEIYNTLNVLALFKKATFLFETIDDCSYANKVKEYETELLQAFRKKYVTEDLYVSCRSQTAQSVALLLDVFTEDEKKKAFENLLTLIDEVGAYKTGCGGVKALFIVLSKYGYDDLALKLMTQKDKMSFYKWIEQGMTSLGEFIYETHEGSIFRRDSGRILSRNHHQFGSISTWFYRYIGGMHINPNMDNPNYIVIKPHRFNEIGYVKITYARNGYELEYEVKKNSDKLDIVVLKNTGFDLEIG